MLARKHQLLLLLFSLFTINFANAQLGGSYSYAFLNLTNSARVAALGGEMISVYDNDLNLAFHNPALLNDSMDNHLVFNYVGYFADIKYGYASYARNLPKIGNVALGIHHINYGEFIEADATSQKLGTFSAAEYAVNIMWSKYLDSLFYVGGTIKPIYNSLEQYNSFALAIDLGISYFSEDKLFSASLAIQNAGIQLKKYYAGAENEPLPFKIQVGISQKLQYAPFRIYATISNLQKFNLSYESDEDESTSSIYDDSSSKKSKLETVADNTMRHVNLGVEFTPLDNFYLRMGYNYRRRQELKIDDRVAMVGFSWGFGIKIKRFHLSYGRAMYHLSGASNHFSISTNLHEFYRRN